MIVGYAQKEKDKKGKRRTNRTTLGRDGVLERSEHACHAAANARLRAWLTV